MSNSWLLLSESLLGLLWGGTYFGSREGWFLEETFNFFQFVNLILYYLGRFSAHVLDDLVLPLVGPDPVDAANGAYKGRVVVGGMVAVWTIGFVVLVNCGKLVGNCV